MAQESFDFDESPEEVSPPVVTVKSDDAKAVLHAIANKIMDPHAYEMGTFYDVPDW